MSSTSPRSSDEVALSFIIPVRVEALSLAAGYVALLSLCFVGGPASLVAALAGWDHTSGLGIRLGAVAIGLVLGALPPGLLGWLGIRRLRRQPELRGIGRAIFALVVAGLMAVACLIGLAGIALS